MIYQENAFINCPFDNSYFPLLKPLLFTLIYNNINPQISETSDSGEFRLSQIKRLISNSKYSIHDLSRMEPLKDNDLPRFNMPFECGIDFGLKLSDDKLYSDKKILILEKEKHRYKQVISDISGNDIFAHENNPEKIIKVVRDWFKTQKTNIPGYKEIWLEYNDFSYKNDKVLKKAGLDSNDFEALPFSEIIENMKTWIEKRKIETAHNKGS